MRRLALFGAALVMAAPAFAHDPYSGSTIKGADGVTRSCCAAASEMSTGDCFETQSWLVDGDRLEALVPPDRGGPLWVFVDPAAITPYPGAMAGPSLCWRHDLGVRCYMPGRAF